MNASATKTVNSYWIRLVIVWSIWLFILGGLSFLIIQELRKPALILQPEAPLTEINTSKVDELREKLLER